MYSKKCRNAHCCMLKFALFPCLLSKRMIAPRCPFQNASIVASRKYVNKNILIDEWYVLIDDCDNKCRLR